jgi:hypothetical protein
LLSSSAGANAGAQIREARRSTGTQCGGDTECEARQHDDQGGEEKNATVERGLTGDRQRFGNQAGERRNGRARHEYPRHSAHQGEEDALGGQLPNDPLTSRAECRAHGDLAAASDRTGEE